MHAMSRLSDAHLITVISLAGGNYSVISDIGEREREREQRARAPLADRSRCERDLAVDASAAIPAR